MNCSQIFCTFAVETTHTAIHQPLLCCELLSNFLYFCSRNNFALCFTCFWTVVNCSQIFCTFAVETTVRHLHYTPWELWIALKFFVLLQSKQHFIYQENLRKSCELLSNFLYFCSRNNNTGLDLFNELVVNCSQIFCTFAVETTLHNLQITAFGCELLSNFLYFCSRNNPRACIMSCVPVVNCSQIFCTFAVETTY